MRRETENAVAAVLAAVCLLVAGWQAALRAVPRFVPLETDRPELTVSVTGEVHEPGLYVLPWGSLTAELIDAAGGLTAAAEHALVNPAAPLASGDTVHVPEAGTADGDGRVSLNSADAWTLQKLPGVGPGIAERIIAGRPYHTAGELRRVSGIGPATWARLAPLVKP